ncbi:hypothetical protein E0I26_16060 [Flavobacterium rhamnosiphilum]|uniref:Uncharacterized protein n=1 Tax=Flavobacterium rhamnosiphilum TaxID=2541724 RepID=A0A4R5F3A8_9FLAO|nr:hypothetical protein [Flavobacterium rhamnosiphilum]TDE41691.1 hypothetical protein E0I26_16060 [Flavobacterium rhamnosiphilum]
MSDKAPQFRGDKSDIVRPIYKLATIKQKTGMKYLQENLTFDFTNHNDNSEEFCTSIILKNIEVEFRINKKYFENEIIDWEFVKVFTLNFIKHFDFIFKKSKRIATILYNEYGNNVESTDAFNKDNCRFTNLLLVELLEPPRIFPYPKTSLNFIVDNIFDSEFTYLDSSCIFANYKEVSFVGVKASNMED